MISWWTMYLKQHYPLEFYCASLASYGDKNQLELLKDAVRHGLAVFPPDPVYAEVTWTPDHVWGAVRAGLAQIPGLAEKTAAKIIEYRQENTVDTWDDLLPIRGIGHKKIETIKEFCAMDDPFEIHKLERQVAKAVEYIKSRDGRRARLPVPTHTAAQVPYSQGETVEVVWCGVITKRNLKELFEMHFSRTGEELNPEDVKDPDLNEWVVMWGNDGTDMLTVTVNRWRYPRLREQIWDIKLDQDIVLCMGYKPGIQSRRAIQVTEMWILSDDE